MAKGLLIVEDDPGLQSQLRWTFSDYKPYAADDRESAIAAVRRYHPAVITLDLGLPPDPGGATEGLAALQDILALTPSAKVIVVTGNDDNKNPVYAIGLGAYDYYQKPIDPEILSFVVKRAFKLSALEEENRKLSRLHVINPLEGIIGASPEIHEVCRMVERLAPTDMTVLLLGESGTGKEVLARTLHRLSPRAGKPFIAVNCAAIPETLLESELFGYEKGAYTGAFQQTKGKFELAHGGTFFLDEVGDIPLSLQPKLLRVLQDHAVERIGGRQEIQVDIRVIAATHQDLSGLIQEGRFREDLFYRMNEIIINIPPLRDREGDVMVLAGSFLDTFTRQFGRNLLGFSDAARAALEDYHWPGNVRELQHTIKRAVVMSAGPLINPSDLQLSAGEVRTRVIPLREAREVAERKAVCAALAEAGENISKAAELLEITRPTLYALLNRFNLKV